MSSINDLARDVREDVEQELRTDLATKGVLRDELGTYDTNTFSLQRGSGQLLVTIGVPVGLMVAQAVTANMSVSDVAAATSPEAAAEAASSARIWTFGVLALSVAVMVVYGLHIKRYIVDYAAGMSVWMDRIARGDTNMEIEGQERPDEFGAMARSLEILRRGTNRLLQLTDRQRKARAEREELRLKQERELLELADHFDRTVGDVVSGVAAASTQLHSTATEMSKAAEQSTAKSEDVAKSMEEAAQGASAAAAASDEFAMSIGEISRQAADSAELARKARGTAGEADETISALDQAATQIGQVVELISTIASRTNLLALNASIEAARGGEAGRGFAVVASEVKELASQTTRATEDVAAQIKSIQESTGASVSALRTVSTEIQQIESTAIAIASAVDQQSVAGQDLARSIDRAARNSEDVGNHVREVRENALMTGSAASQVLNSASELERQASTLREHVDTFMAKVRSKAD